MSDDKSLVAIVPTSQVASLVGQFLGTGAGGSQQPGPSRQRTESRRGRQAGPHHGHHRHDRERHRHQGADLSHDLLPQWNGFQLIGDSMMVRLATYTSSAKSFFNKDLKANQLGLCISGQTASQLLRMLRSPKCPKLHTKIILMIGTNNILKRVKSDDTKSAIKQVVDHILKSVEKLIILSVPPIPKVASIKAANEDLADLNTFLMSIACSDKITHHNLHHHFYNNNELKHGMFEKDEIHWTRGAIELVLQDLREGILLHDDDNDNELMKETVV